MNHMKLKNILAISLLPIALIVMCTLCCKHLNLKNSQENLLQRNRQLQSILNTLEAQKQAWLDSSIRWKNLYLNDSARLAALRIERQKIKMLSEIKGEKSEGKIEQAFQNLSGSLSEIDLCQLQSDNCDSQEIICDRAIGDLKQEMKFKDSCLALLDTSLMLNRQQLHDFRMYVHAERANTRKKYIAYFFGGAATGAGITAIAFIVPKVIPLLKK